MFECPVNDWLCPYFENGDCTLENCEQECDAFYTGNEEEKEEEEDNKMYRLIDDPLCDVYPNIDAYENCKDCPYFFDCMEEDLED